MSKSKVSIIKGGADADINIEEVSYKGREGVHQSSLVLYLSGKDINIKIVNALRRVATNNIPTYAFPPECINIIENTCTAYNNDYMRLRLSTLPIFDIDSELFFLNEKYWKNVNFADPKREKHPNEQNIELYVNVHNNSNAIRFVTTNDIRYYVDGDQKQPYDEKYPILLIKLRPNDTFKCDMKASLSMADDPVRDGRIIWSQARSSTHHRVVIYDKKTRQIEDEEDYFLRTGKDIKDYKGEIGYKLQIDSVGQLHEYNILSKSAKYILKKLEDFSKEIDKKSKAKEFTNTKGNIIVLVLDGDDHTMGELLNYEFQSHPEIINSGCTKPDHLIKSISIKVEPVSKANFSKVINECIDSLVAKFKKLEKIFEDNDPTIDSKKITKKKK